MTVLNDEILMAFVDGELSPEQEEEVCQLLAEDPAAQDTLAAMAKSRDLLRKAFTHVLEEPVPAKLLEAIRLTAQQEEEDIASPPAAKQTRIAQFTPKPALRWAAAITLIVGGMAAYLSSGYLRDGEIGSAPVAAVDTFLDEALEQTVSGTVFTRAADARPGDTAQQREIMPRLSFRDHQGRFCREYEEQLAGSSATTSHLGVACRENGHWQPLDLAGYQGRELPKQASPSGHYVPAMGEEESGNLDSLIDTLMQGSPLSPAEESSLIENKWNSALQLKNFSSKALFVTLVFP